MSLKGSLIVGLILIISLIASLSISLVVPIVSLIVKPETLSPTCRSEGRADNLRALPDERQLRAEYDTTPRVKIYC